ncbi:HIT domain-containing protein [Candidatus Parcubacteria bacterium]|nr:HIT domain-containing protein [Patescibacteria group bacterium]MBU4466619.1 HIT domain-containing protein [Patescibacteria group bacterium]MCG2688355.1 HIT domain-containing protein [Candidatus Parcubacteria bacterium]
MNKKIILFSIITLIVGIVIGGYLFRDVQPRSFLAVDYCDENCLNPNELLGLIGSVGIQKLPGLIPLIVKETDKTIVMDSPVHEATIHYVIIPKKDIKDIGDISEEDKGYLIDAYAIIGQIIREEKLEKYKIYTNGPSYQTVNYLHFHLLAEGIDE